jgi:hypothetical protein
MYRRRENDEEGSQIYQYPQSTGSVSDSNGFHVAYINFEKYVIGIILDSNNKFIDIVEVREKRDFLSTKQRLSKRSVVDVDEFYKE